jgi:hypothetical protein
MRVLVLAAAIIAALAIAACGGSSGSNGWTASQKAKVKSELNSEFTLPHSTPVLNKDIAAVKSCVENVLFTKYAPNAHLNTNTANKLLHDACGTQFKQLQHQIKVAEATSEKKTITSGSSSN